MFNLARLFSYTRRIEDDLTRALQKIAELEIALEQRTVYAFSLCGRLTPEQMKERVEKKMTADVQPLPPPRSLRNVRQGLLRDAMSKIADKNAVEPDSVSDAMKARADEFVEKTNGHAS